MKYLKNGPMGWDYPAYVDYLQGVSHPCDDALEFARAEWNHNWRDHRSAHNGWIEKILIREDGALNHRVINMRLELLTYHEDFRLVFDYIDVVGYAFSVPSSKRRSWETNRRAKPWVDIGHSYWRVDELLFLDDGVLSHDILLSEDGTLQVLCVDFIYDLIAVADGQSVRSSRRSLS
jgi:hypothetical protein